MWKNQTLSSDATVTNAGVLTISNNAISNAKLATGTAGNLISYYSTDNPMAVATGNAGQVLTSRGAGRPPSFASLPAVVAITSLNGLNGTSQTFTNRTCITVTSDRTAHTIAVNTGTVATLTGTQTLTNKTITAADNSLSMALTDLSNVTIDTAADTNILIYDGSSTTAA